MNQSRWMTFGELDGLAERLREAWRGKLSLSFSPRESVWQLDVYRAVGAGESVGRRLAVIHLESQSELEIQAELARVLRMSG